MPRGVLFGAVLTMGAGTLATMKKGVVVDSLNIAARRVYAGNRKRIESSAEVSFPEHAEGRPTKDRLHVFYAREE